jgi:hypothetical protein
MKLKDAVVYGMQEQLKKQNPSLTKIVVVVLLLQIKKPVVVDKEVMIMQNKQPNKTNSCCTPENTCCGTSEVITNQIKQKSDDSKISVDIFVPLDACACEWDKFMNRAFEAITPYIKHIRYATKNLNSEEARNLNLHGNSVVIDGERKFTATYMLKKELPNILRAKGLI